LRGWGRKGNIKLPHIVSNVIAEYKPVASGVKVIMNLMESMEKNILLFIAD
jgi:hypothetical protein